MTSKEWVVPPRPKPGRKPATDTPPTKRKAQNRAAQRAFRERRAARVGELEELLDQQKDEHDGREGDFKERLRELELQVQSFRSRCSLLESMLDRERQDRVKAESRANDLQRLYDTALRDQGRQRQNEIFTPQQPDFFTQSQRSSISYQPHVESSASRPAVEEHMTCGDCAPNGPCACADAVMASASTGCGKCGIGSPCQCFDDAVQAPDMSQSVKRPAPSPRESSHTKRQRPNESAGEQNPVLPYPTQSPSQATGSNLRPAQLTPDEELAMKEGCGFCKDGTYCVCADAALATQVMTPMHMMPPIRLPQEQTPPPSETEDILTPMPMEMTADGAVKLPPRKQRKAASAPSPTSRDCGPNGPGTCTQCQADPKSGLFCRLISARFDSKDDQGGCCGGKGPDGGCCKSTAAAVEPQKQTLPSLPSLGLSCAEAYQTLSSHRNFDQAADDIGSWLPKLRAAPKEDRRAAPRAIEVEAASIMSVLKDFDVRFGREA